MTSVEQNLTEPETTRITISWSKDTDRALRSYLGDRGMKKGALSKFIEEAVRWRFFHKAVGDARQAFADVPESELVKQINAAVEAVRTKRFRRRIGRR
ncbi:MAG: ribbon-helix-helix domain-containing protein [Terriglobales bacterium]|jgi:hypothetical protein